MARYTNKQFHAEFPNDAACLERVMQVRYDGTELTCPGCGTVEAKFHPLTKRRAYACQECGFHIYPCAESIFHKSCTPLTSWFLAMFLLTNTRHGVSAKELQRQTGHTYKCCWRMLHELRKLMSVADFGGMLTGHVEVDETQYGGKQKRQDKEREGTNKSIVMGMVERNGKMIAGPVDDTYAATLQHAVLDNVEPGSILSTDELHAYVPLVRFYKHGTVKHGKGEYVKGIHHTNTIEAHWGLFKRSIKGTHNNVSAKHLWKYVNEFSYRQNFRRSQLGMFTRLVSAFGLPRVAET